MYSLVSIFNPKTVKSRVWRMIEVVSNIEAELVSLSSTFICVINGEISLFLVGRLYLKIVSKVISGMAVFCLLTRRTSRRMIVG